MVICRSIAATCEQHVWFHISVRATAGSISFPTNHTRPDSPRLSHLDTSTQSLTTVRYGLYVPAATTRTGCSYRLASAALRGVHLDEVVNSKDRDGGLGGEVQTLDLAQRRLHNTGTEVVDDLTLDQIQAHVLQVRLVGLAQNHE